MTEKIGLLFPGQGAQFVGMGKDLAETYPQVKALFDKASDILGYRLDRLCFEGPEEELTRTVYAQPAIYVASMAALEILRMKEPGFAPDLTAGLSLGEFSALTAAGALDFEDGLNLVKLRAEAMEAAAVQNPGTMASVMGLNLEDCRSIAEQAGCEVANLNAADQIVLSGTFESIDKACVLAEGRGAKRALKLKVGGAFHSSLMQPARERLESALKSTKVSQPSCVFIPNAKAVGVSDPEEIRKLLSLQLTSPVRWYESMDAAKSAGVLSYLEVGPGKVLKGLVRKSIPEFQVQPCGTCADFEKLDEFLRPSAPQA
ncbi:MAG: ACP S-malonyltransferase [Candidatus Omnitrophica bacterium]|nr:ACP S-malonyltransferase [Candidatus Omnitrophota bacterium]